MSHNFSAIIISLSLIFPTLFLTDCTGSDELNDRLSAAESLIMELPDSSLTILEEIDTLDFVNDRDRAKYGLLYTMALDKCHLDPKDDNIITFSADYYKKRGDIENQIKAEYYRGRVYYLREEYQKALVSFFKAKDKAEQTPGQIFWAGMACRGISDIYCNFSNSADALNYAQKEYEAIKESGIQPYLNYSLLDLCRSYNNINNNEQALLLSNQLLDSASSYKDDYLYYCALNIKAVCLFRLSNYLEAEENFKELLKNEFSNAEDSLIFIWNLVEMDKIKEGKELIKDVSVSNINMPLKHMIEYQISKRESNETTALSELEILYNRLDTNHYKRKNINLSTTIANYYEWEQKYEVERLKSQRFKFYLIFGLSFLLLIILVMISLMINKDHKFDIERKRSIIEELGNKLQVLEKKEFESKEKIKGLLKSQNELVAEIGDIIRFNPEVKTAKKRIEEKINEVIEGISLHGKKLPSLEERINKFYDNLFRNFREDLPCLKDEDYALFLYYIMGMSNASVQVFLRENNIMSVYNRKKRLKEKIKTLTSEKRDRYLELLS